MPVGGAPLPLAPGLPLKLALDVDTYMAGQRSAALLVVHDGKLRLERYGLGFLPYFPLASGLLSGKYRRGEPPPADTRFGAMGTGFADGIAGSASIRSPQAAGTARQIWMQGGDRFWIL